MQELNETAKFYDLRGEAALKALAVDADPDPELSFHLMAPYLAAYQEVGMAPSPGSRILDIGCGTGQHTIQFAKQGWQVVGIDFSAKSLAAATERAHKHGVQNSCRFFKTSIEDFMAQGTEKFDVLFSSGVLYYLRPATRQEIASRLLTPDGRLVFIETLGDNRLMDFYRRLRARVRKDRDNETLNDLIRLDEMQTWAKRFQTGEVRGFDFFTLIGAVVFRRNALGRFFQPLAVWLDKILLNVLNAKRLSFKILFIGQGAKPKGES